MYVHLYHRRISWKIANYKFNVYGIRYLYSYIVYELIRILHDVFRVRNYQYIYSKSCQLF